MSLKYKKNEIKIIYFQHDVLPILYKILGDIKEWYFFKILIEGMARFFFGLLFYGKRAPFSQRPCSNLATVFGVYCLILKVFQICGRSEKEFITFGTSHSRIL